MNLLPGILKETLQSSAPQTEIRKMQKTTPAQKRSAAYKVFKLVGFPFHGLEKGSRETLMRTTVGKKEASRRMVRRLTAKQAKNVG